MKNSDKLTPQEFWQYAAQYVSFTIDELSNFMRFANVLNIRLSTLIDYKHAYFYMYLKDSNFYFYINNDFVDYGPLPKLDPYPNGIPMINGAPQNPSSPTPTPTPTPAPAPAPTPAPNGQSLDIKNNKVNITLQQFIKYCADYNVVITDKDAKGFEGFAIIHKVNTAMNQLEIFKHYYFHHYKLDNNFYFYINNEFIDYGPLPRLQPYPTNIKVKYVNGVPQNPYGPE